MSGRLWDIRGIVICFMVILAITGIALLHGQTGFASETGSHAQIDAQEAISAYGYKEAPNLDLAQDTTPCLRLWGRRLRTEQ